MTNNNSLKYGGSQSSTSRSHQNQWPLVLHTKPSVVGKQETLQFQCSGHNHLERLVFSLSNWEQVRPRLSQTRRRREWRRNRTGIGRTETKDPIMYIVYFDKLHIQMSKTGTQVQILDLVFLFRNSSPPIHPPRESLWKVCRRQVV